MKIPANSNKFPVQNFRTFYIILFLILQFGLLKAQPGWRDATKRYFYTIIDQNGKEISFKENGNYSIMIDGILYNGANIPQNPIRRVSNTDKEYQNQILINDFSLSIPQKEIVEENTKRLEIKIIYKKDTMLICQPSGTGGILESWDLQDKLSEKPEADYKLPFLAGHYYFPNWNKYISNKLPKTNGKVKFLNTKNLNQQYFIIPKNIYNSSLLYNKNTYGNQRETGEDQYVIDHFFLNGYLTLEKRTEQTKINNLSVKYSWMGKPESTRDPDRFWGMVDISGDITTFFSLQKEENRMELFLPDKDGLNFTCGSPYVNSFSKVIYLPVWIKQESNNYSLATLYNKIPSEKYIYSSKDEGKTWQKDKEAKNIFDKYSILDENKSPRRVAFMDKDYAVIYYKEVIERNETKNRIKEQGIYYLLKNMKVIDSLKTPKNNNFLEYNELSIQNNSVILGKYWPDQYCNVDFQLSLKKSNDNWKFHVDEKRYIQNSTKEQNFQKKDSIKQYENFQLINNRELIFKNGSGKMILNDEFSDYSHIKTIIERDKEIYLVSYESVFLSFDGGTNWYIYPASILPNTYYYLLDINSKNEINYFSNNRTDSSNSITTKTFYKFSPK